MDKIEIPVFQEIEKKDCSGCSACVNICPVQIIEMLYDEEGFLYPEADMQKCIHCNQCVKSCPQVGDLAKINNEFKLFAGSAIQEKTVLHGSSGGIFELIAKIFLEKSKDNYLYGVVWDDDFRSVKHIGINSISHLEALKTSKYIQSDKNHIFAEIKEKLNSNSGVMFVGTPCEVAGLKKFLSNVNCEKLITIDFICKGPTSPLFMKKYIEEIEAKQSAKVTYVNMRYKWEKLDCWIPQFILIKFDNSKSILKEFYNTEIGHAFRILQRPSCYKCKYTGTNKLSDITLGDYHGVKTTDVFYNNLGTSIVMANSKRGYEIVECLIGDKLVDFYEQNIATVCEVNPNFAKGGMINCKRQQLAKDIQTKSLKKSIGNVISIKDKIKMLIPWKIQRKIIMAKKGR